MLTDWARDYTHDDMPGRVGSKVLTPGKLLPCYATTRRGPCPPKDPDWGASCTRPRGDTAMGGGRAAGSWRAVEAAKVQSDKGTSGES